MPALPRPKSAEEDMPRLTRLTPPTDAKAGQASSLSQNDTASRGG
jgi:hypothetical protein